MPCPGTLKPVIRVHKVTRAGSCSACDRTFPRDEQVPSADSIMLAPRHQRRRGTVSSAIFGAGAL